MFRDLPRHAAYKSNSSPWLGDLPAHWSLARTKTLLTERSQKGYPDEPLLAATQSHGVIRKSDYETRTVTATKDLHLLKLVEVGDFVVSLRSFQGGIERCYHRGIISPAYTVLTAHDDSYRDYLTYLFKSRHFIDSLTLAVTGIREGQNIDYSRLAVDLLPVPPVEEQAAIVKYLAHANARIDNAIAAKRRLIALLEEQTRVETSAVMSQAVSDGSKTLPLKRVIDLRGGMTPSKENLSYWGGDVPWISPKDVKSATLLGSIDRITEAALEQTSISMVSAGSVVIVVRGMILARTIPVAVLGVDATLNQDMKALVPKAGVLEPRYLRDWLKSNEDMLVQLVETAGHGTKKLDTDSLMNVRVAVPSVEVQREVCTRVDQANQATRRTIERIEQEIVILQEFRIRLVSDAVLGQVDVRAISASLLDAPSGVAMQDIHAAVTDDDFGTDDAGKLE